MENMKSLKKVFEILELYIEVPRENLSLSEMAKLTGLKISTVNRIASTLVDLGYLAQQKKRGKYSIGRNLIYFAGLLEKQNTFKSLIKPYMNRLNEETGETVFLVNYDNDKLYFVDNIYSRSSFNILADPTFITPLYCSSVGKVFLAEYSESELEEYIANKELKKFTSNTITDIGKLKKNLAEARKNGFAFDDEELISGVRSVASGIKDSSGKTFCCVGISGPNVRMTQSKVSEIAIILKGYTDEISREIGYKGK